MTVPLGDLVQVAKGRKPSRILSEQEPGSVRLIQIADLRPDVTPRFCPVETGAVWTTSSDVVIAWDGANAGESSWGISGVLGSTMGVLRPDAARVDTAYLGQFLRSEEAALRRNCKGATVPHVDPAYLRQIRVPLPSLAEQRRIAAILDSADDLRAKRRGTITELDDLTQSIFLDMFGDGAQLDAAPLSAVAQVRGGLTVNSKRSALPNRAPYLRVANVGRGVLDLAEIKTIGVTDAELEGLGLERDDLLLVEGHGNRGEVGRVARWTGPIARCVHQNHLIRIRLDQRSVLPVFAEHYLNSRGGRAQVASVAKTTSGLNTISISQVRALKVPLPRMSDQRLFAERVGSVADQVAMAQESLRQLDILFASLQGHAFRDDQAR